jgi:hypothetical protein
VRSEVAEFEAEVRRDVQEFEAEVSGYVKVLTAASADGK